MVTGLKNDLAATRPRGQRNELPPGEPDLHVRRKSILATASRVFAGAIIGGLIGTMAGALYGLLNGVIHAALGAELGNVLPRATGFALAGAVAGVLTGAFARLFEGDRSEAPLAQGKSLDSAHEPRGPFPT